jgi:hypothetical protein
MMASNPGKNGKTGMFMPGMVPQAGTAAESFIAGASRPRDRDRPLVGKSFLHRNQADVISNDVVHS